jgi:hypothetical protein
LENAVKISTHNTMADRRAVVADSKALKVSKAKALAPAVPFEE